MPPSQTCDWQIYAVGSFGSTFEPARVTEKPPFRLRLCGAGLPGTARRNRSTGMGMWVAATDARSWKLHAEAARKDTSVDGRVHCRRLRNFEAEIHVHFLDWAEACVRTTEYSGP